MRWHPWLCVGLLLFVGCRRVEQTPRTLALVRSIKELSPPALPAQTAPRWKALADPVPIGATPFGLLKMSAVPDGPIFVALVALPFVFEPGKTLVVHDVDTYVVMPPARGALPHGISTTVRIASFK